jgi:hypothetical protein
VQDLWEEVRDVMRWRHFAPGHNEIDSIKRLLSRPPWSTDLGISRRNSKVEVELWDRALLWRLILENPSLITDKEPAKTSGAIVVVRWAGREYLIDGRRRINHWQRNGVTGPHRVLVISERLVISAPAP